MTQKPTLTIEDWLSETGYSFIHYLRPLRRVRAATSERSGELLDGPRVVPLSQGSRVASCTVVTPMWAMGTPSMRRHVLRAGRSLRSRATQTEDPTDLEWPLGGAGQLRTDPLLRLSSIVMANENNMPERWRLDLATAARRVDSQHMIRDRQTTLFDVSIEGGDPEKIKVSTGLFASAAAAVPAILGIEDFPVRIRIWVDDLLPQQRPFDYVIAEAGGEPMLDTNERFGRTAGPRRRALDRLLRSAPMFCRSRCKRDTAPPQALDRNRGEAWPNVKGRSGAHCRRRADPS